MSGKKGMPCPRYSEEMKSNIKQMVLEGITHREIAEHFGLKDRFVVHQILKRDRRKQEAQGTIPKKKGRPSSNTTLAALKAENQQLRMENDLMKTFLAFMERG